MIIKRLIMFALIIFLTNCLHLKGHNAVSNSLAELNKIQDQIMIHINQLNQNKLANDKRIPQAKGVQQKIAILQAYLHQQTQQILSIIKESIVNLNQTSYICPPITQSDRSALSTFNQNINTAFLDLSKQQPKLGSQKDQKNVVAEVNNIIPFIALNNLPVYEKSTQSNSNLINKTNINLGFYILDNTSQKIVSTQQNSQICALQTPFVNQNGQCSKCPPQKPYFSVQNSTCIECKNYKQSTRTCQAALFFTNLEAGNSQLLLAEQQTINDYNQNKDSLPICPAETPFYNGNACIACSSKLYFSLKDKSCQTCPSGKFYNIYKQKCQIQLYFSNLNNLKWQVNNKQVDDILQSITIKRSNESYVSCPLEMPFSLQYKCIKCDKDTHFSYDKLSCTRCSSETQLDSNMHKCLKPGNLNFQTNPLNTSNLIYNGRSKNEWMNIYYQNIHKYSGIVDCPQDLPNFDGLACISCPHSHPYFNLQLMVCQACEGTTLYDPTQRQCVNSNDNQPIQTPSWQKMAAVVFAK